MGSGNPAGSEAVEAPMSLGRNILLRMFGRPRGLPGRLGGIIMARTNYRHAAWVTDQLDVQQHDTVLEVGFGPGVAVDLDFGQRNLPWVLDAAK